VTEDEALDLRKQITNLERQIANDETAMVAKLRRTVDQLFFERKEA